jgi:hypothetical protein
MRSAGRIVAAAANARLFAIENFAAADAAIGCWESKYHWNYWRPITAIREAASDGNRGQRGRSGARRECRPPAREASPTAAALSRTRVRAASRGPHRHDPRSSTSTTDARIASASDHVASPGRVAPRSATAAIAPAAAIR